MYVKVKKGQTLYKIAKHHHTTVSRILNLNPELRARPDIIYPGEYVRVH